MREFKFRGYDFTKNKIIPFEKIRPLNYVYDVEMDEMFQGMQNHLKLMQYTGEIDKNGVEIYEGDIVKAVAGLAYREIVCVGKVEFNYSSWILTYKDEKFYDGIGYVTFDHLSENNCSFEVIGNIYENQDLLSEVK